MNNNDSLNNREWLRGWVETKRPDWSQSKIEKAIDIAENAFQGSTGIGTAADIGIKSVEKANDSK